MKTVIFGGTFNPIHLGHIEIIKNVAADDSVEKVLVIPARTPPHKICDDLACDADRLEMCKIATHGIEKVTVSDMELLRTGKSYTVDTLRKIKADDPYCQLALVCGGDMIVSFDTWRSYEDILDLAEIIAVRRVGIDDADFDAAVTKLLNMGGRVSVLKNRIIGISSTEVKQHLTDPEYMLTHIPKGVYNYIKDNGLYGSK